jgi:hypothetical protein
MDRKLVDGDRYVWNTVVKNREIPNPPVNQTAILYPAAINYSLVKAICELHKHETFYFSAVLIQARKS